MLKGVIQFFIIFYAAVLGFNFPPCPEICYCTIDFTDCKYNDLNDLPSNIDINVTSLDLSYNNFSLVPPKLVSFHNLVNLNLSHNQISMLDDNFNKLHNLERLDFTYNRFMDWIDIRPLALSNLKKLLFLDFSHNHIRSIYGLHNPLKINSLEVLRLNNCSMRTISSTIIENLPRLKELHVALNPIRYLNSSFTSNSLKFLDLSGCELRHIAPTTFINLNALETLWLYKNSNLKKFPCSSDSLLYLDISDCNLEVAPDGNLSKVYQANFHGNNFRSIVKYMFKNMPVLRIVDLSQNGIVTIEQNAFRNLEFIEEIDLSVNLISSLASDLFYSNVNLRKLYLNKNYLYEIEKFATNSLETLDLSNCEIQSMTRDCLASMPNLKHLNVSMNYISTLPDYLQSSSLESLDLNYCHIKNVNNRTFQQMHSLRRLTLAGNRLTVLHPDFFPQVITLEIYDNPWRCDCPALRPFYSWLRRTGKLLDNLVCQSPDAVEGLSWLASCQTSWQPDTPNDGASNRDTIWYYTVGMLVGFAAVLFVVVALRRAHKARERRAREEADEQRRTEDRERLREMRRVQACIRDEEIRNAPDPRESQRPPSYHEALLMPKLMGDLANLSGSLHSVASKASNTENGGGGGRRGSTGGRRKRRRRRRSDTTIERMSRASTVDDSDSSGTEGRGEGPPAQRPLQPTRQALESDF